MLSVSAMLSWTVLPHNNQISSRLHSSTRPWSWTSRWPLRATPRIFSTQAAVVAVATPSHRGPMRRQAAWFKPITLWERLVSMIPNLKFWRKRGIGEDKKRRTRRKTLGQRSKSPFRPPKLAMKRANVAIMRPLLTSSRDSQTRSASISRRI